LLYENGSIVQKWKYEELLKEDGYVMQPFIIYRFTAQSKSSNLAIYNKVNGTLRLSKVLFCIAEFHLYIY